MTNPVLSVCINTRNRSSLLAETLDSILSQAGPRVEVVVVDGASTDETPQLMAQYVSANPSQVTYYRFEALVGIDEGYDKSVELARGQYCWLMTDDDLLEQGAIERALTEIANGFELILVNMSCFTRDLRTSLNQVLYQTPIDRRFDSGSQQDFLAVCGKGLSYIGSVIIRRSHWFVLERKPYYGTYFAHVAVILANLDTGPILLIAFPYIRYRSGNVSWTARSFEIWYFKWPQLIWETGAISDAMKQSVVPREPWRRILSLLKSRATGELDRKVLRRFLRERVSGPRYAALWIIAVLPRTLLNLAILVFCLVFRGGVPYTIYNLAISNPHPKLASRVAALFGHRFRLAES